MNKENGVIKVIDWIKTELWPELQQRLSEHFASLIQQERNDERDNNIALAALAMLDAGVSDDVTLHMMQKHWDLRQSEADSFLNWAHNRIKCEALPK